MNALSSILNWIGSVIGANPNTLTTSNKTIVGAINEVDAFPHVLESGSVQSTTTDPTRETTATWTYRKWSDGVMECWCQSNEATITPSDWSEWRNIYEALLIDKNITYPTGFFISAPQIYLQAVPTSGYTIISAEVSIAGSHYDASKHTPKVYGIRANPPSGNITAVVNFHAVGRWQA